MADLSDVCTYLAQQSVAAVYPSGTSQPSVAAMDVRVFEGWPVPDQLDLDLSGKTMIGVATASPPIKRANGPMANVSIYPMPGTGVSVYQILDETYVITPAAITTTMSVVGTVITVTGTLSTGEFLTLVIDNATICSQTGANVAAMLSALAAQAVAAGYAATSTATTLTVPYGHSMVVRQGGQGVIGKVTHRQRQSIMVTVWAPTHVARNALAKAIDGLIKQTNKVSMPDTSQALVIYSRTTQSDEQQMATIYRRDLIYDVEYATVQQFPGQVITSTQQVCTDPNNAAIATAIT